jgi:hypothetical protein
MRFILKWIRKLPEMAALAKNRYLTPCDRCRAIFCRQRVDFLRRYAFSMFDDPAECPDFEERTFHGLEGVRP